MKSDFVRRGFIELILIALGILAAFSLDSWWEKRSLYDQELGYLEDMRDEFALAADSLDQLASYARRNVAQLELLESLLGPGRSAPPADSVAGAAGVLWWFQIFAPAMPAYDELRASIGTSGVTDPGLRRALFEYESTLGFNRLLEEYIRGATVGFWEPILSSRIPHSAVRDPRLSFDPRRLSVDLEFRNVIALRLSTERDLETVRAHLADAARDVAQLIGPRPDE